MRKLLIIPSALISITILSFLSLTSNPISAESSTTSNISVSVPVSCNITNTKDTPHTATINPGTYKEDIGTTTFKVFCNDNAGYSIYAIGYSNEEYGNTNLIPTNTSNPNITTGTTTSGNTSSWSMKLNPLPGDYAPTIENDFNTYRTVPDIYTKVATLTSSTDFTIGSTLQSTYKAYIQSNQPADTYTGKVKYALVHPNDAKPPVDPRFVANLDTGETINMKIADLPNVMIENTISIATIARADSLPTGFIPSDANTISLPSSLQPVYIFFDDGTRTLYYYSDASYIYMNSNSSFAFGCVYNLSNIDGLSDWDTSKVTDMSNMFFGGCDAYDGEHILTNLDALANWDVSNVESMASMFFEQQGLTDIGGISRWDTSNVTDMTEMFSRASSLTNIDALSNWDTSNVTDMGNMFYAASSLTNIDGASNWDTSAVTDMSWMFDNAKSLTNIDGASNWDTSSVTDMSWMFYGTNLTNIDALENWDTSSVTNMSWMLSYILSLTNIDALSNWDTSAVADMSWMFTHASSLTNINSVRNWNTGNVTDISNIFRFVNNIDATVLNNWDVSKITNKEHAFTCPVDKQPSWY